MAEPKPQAYDPKKNSKQPKATSTSDSGWLSCLHQESQENGIKLFLRSLSQSQDWWRAAIDSLS
jgi:hypothetical protein